MCLLTRRNLLLGSTGLLMLGCSDGEESNQAKDYYPVTTSGGFVLHWGQNNTIIIDESASGSPSVAQLAAFRIGLDAWVATLQEVGVTLSYSSVSPDVKVNWLTAAEMEARRGSSSVLGYASTNKNIYMRTDLDEVDVAAVGIHEFGHMLGIWSHSFDRNDIMYPYLYSLELSNRDKRTVVDFLYQLPPDWDMHDRSGPLTSSLTGAIIPETISTFTADGCRLSTS